MSATLTASFGTVDEAINWSIELLQQNGFVVRKPEFCAPETPAEFCARLGLHLNSLSRTLRRGTNPPPAEIRRGPSGRILSLRSTAEFDAWIKARQARAGHAVPATQLSTLNAQPPQ